MPMPFFTLSKQKREGESLYGRLALHKYTTVQSCMDMQNSNQFNLKTLLLIPLRSEMLFSFIANEDVLQSVGTG